MQYQDKSLTCVDCGQPFVFTAGEQEFFAQKGFQNPPKRCKPCKAAKRAGSGATGVEGGAARELFEVVCSSCGQKTTVPFKPSLDRPVYCRTCFQLRRS
ncbi:MAG: zinc-ribbon domain containing protein [Candidatus Methylomirabilales bacterium]